jgi:hypothetical protein
MAFFEMSLSRNVIFWNAAVSFKECDVDFMLDTLDRLGNDL